MARIHLTHIRRGRLNHSLARAGALALVALALGALLAACGGAGAAGTPGAGGGSGATGGATTRTSLTPNPTITASPTATSPTGQGSAVASCPAPAIDTAAPNPTRVLTPADHAHTISVQIGAVVEVRLPTAAQRWSFDGKDAPTLTPLAVQGNDVASLHACVWDFTAAQTGKVTLGFVGQPMCAARQPCPQDAMLLPLTVSVS